MGTATNTTPFGRFLRQARLKKGLSMGELGDLIRRSKGTIYDYERGRSVPGDFDVMDALSYYLEVDLEELYANAMVSKNKLLDSHESTALPLMDSFSEDLLGQCYTPKVDPVLATVAKLTRKEIQERAEKAAAILFEREVEQGVAIPIMGLYESPGLIHVVMKHAAPEFAANMKDIETNKFQYTQGVEGRTKYNQYTDRVTVELRADVYRQALAHQGRARFTAAHELAHAFLHHTPLVDAGGSALFRDGSLAASTQFRNWNTNPEWQANEWASAFLMPYDAVVNWIKKAGSELLEDDELLASKMSERFDVSRTAAEIRIQRILPRMLRAFLDKQPNMFGS